jgi:hypothetical protein
MDGLSSMFTWGSLGWKQSTAKRKGIVPETVDDDQSISGQVSLVRENILLRRTSRYGHLSHGDLLSIEMT